MNEDMMPLDCLLWRTLGTPDRTLDASQKVPYHLAESLNDTSGCILCLTDDLAHLAQGLPSNSSNSHTSAVIGFQSFESMIGVKGSKDYSVLYQGVFPIPDEIMASTICQVDTVELSSSLSMP